MIDGGQRIRQFARSALPGIMSLSGAWIGSGRIWPDHWVVILSLYCEMLQHDVNWSLDFYKHVGWIYSLQQWSGHAFEQNTC